MIYAIVGTDKNVRAQVMRELLSFGVVSRYLYRESISDLEPLIDGVSLFEERVIVSCEQLGEDATTKEVLISLLDRMKESQNLFIVDEPFGDVHMVNRLRKVAAKLFDAREEKIKDTSVFGVCDAFVARDKKEAWVRFLDVTKRESGEAVAGALWWKWQILWAQVRAGRPSKFSLKECEVIGKSLVESSIRAHRGEVSLVVEIERIILGL